MKLQPGTLLQGDRYRIIDILGQGGFGITYLAEQVMAERKVCIKEFFPKEYYNRNEDSRSISLGSQGSAEIMDLYKAKFIKEAKTIAKLDHPNIIHIFDVFAENNTAYYVMEYIDGESLSALVKSRGVLPESEAISYIKQVAAALGSIHEQRIMHLDIKPANVMLRKEDGRVVLIDFGLSKQYDADGNQTSSTPAGISAGYAPMEQYQQGGVREFSPETDIYSLGATLYYLVTGVVPPQAATIVDEGLPELSAHLSANVRNAIERSMEVQRKRRPHSIKEFLALLEDNTPIVVPIPTPAPTPAPVSEETAFGAPASNAADERTVVSTPTPKAQPTQQPKKEWVPKYSAEKPKNEEETKKKSKWWLWLLIITVVAIGGYLALSGSNDSETAKSEQVQSRQAEEAEKARIAEERRQAEKAEKARKAEEQRQAEDVEKARIAEEQRKAEEAEEARIAEEDAKAREAAKLVLDKSSVTHEYNAGNYKLAYYLESPYPGMNVTVSESVDWITDAKIDNQKLSYYVSANNATSKREATITLTYNDKKYNVKVTQNGRPTIGTLNGHAWVDLGLPSGTKWATCNVGANKPEQYGNYYAWGETTTKSSYTNENSKTYGKSMSDISGNKAYDAANANWGEGWRMPTKEEFDELRNNCTWTWTNRNGVNGYEVKSKKNGNSNSIFLPAAGHRPGGDTRYAGLYGCYWSSTPLNTSIAYYLYFGDGDRDTNVLGLVVGLSVRPVFAE